MGHGLLFAFLASVCWGIAPIFQKRGLRDMSLLEMNAMRGLGLAVVLLPAFFFVSADVLLADTRPYLVLASVALLNNVVGDLFAFIAIRNIGVSLASPITSAYPLFVTLTSQLWFDETMTAFVLGGTLLVVTGFALLNAGRRADERNLRPSPSALKKLEKNVSGACDSSERERRRHLRGVSAAVLAAFCWAMGLSLNKYLTLRGVSSTAITFWRGAFFSLMAMGVWAGSKVLRPKRQNPTPLSAAGVLSGAISGVLSLIVGSWFYASSLFIVPMNVATPIASTSPLMAALFACAFLGERLRPVQWLGIAVIVTGAVVVSI
jgi:drug/metabolite transporter (DMT)-like permease